MANVLSIDKQVAIISGLAEGSGIRQIERITGVHRDTIMRLGVRVGQGCANLLDSKIRSLACQLVPILLAEAAVRAAIVQEVRSLESAEET
jgi:hypothetical protein